MSKIIIDKLTPEQEAQIPAYRDMWIAKGLQTGETDWATFDEFMPICYEKAGLKYPKNIVRVSSPLVGGLASAVAEAIWKKKRDAVDGAVDDAVRDAVGGAVDGAVDDAVGDAVGDAVRDAVDDAVRVAVHDAVDVAVGGAVRVAVHDAVDVAVGGAVRDAVDVAVRVAVHDAVDVAVGGAVSTAISIAKKAGVTLSWHWWLGGQFWVGGWGWGVAFVNFFFDVCKLKLSKDIMDRAIAYRKVCESVNYIWANSDFVMVCARPTRICRNEDGQLHSDQVKAIEYPDGYGLYALDGVILPEDLWQKIISQTMSFSEIMKIEISDQRTVALKYNPQAIIKENAVLIHKDNRNNELYLVENSEINTLTNFPRMYFLKMLCPTGRIFIEGVEPKFAEAHPNATECQAELCGLVPSEYMSMILES